MNLTKHIQRANSRFPISTPPEPPSSGRYRVDLSKSKSRKGDSTGRLFDIAIFERVETGREELKARWITVPYDGTRDRFGHCSRVSYSEGSMDGKSVNQR